MRNILNISIIDIKLMFRDKMFFFWILILPLLFIFLFGDQKSGISQKASLTVLNRDTGEWGRYFLEKLGDDKIKLEKVVQMPEKFIRLLLIPENFSDHLFKLKSQTLELKIMESSDQGASKKIQMKLAKVIAEIVTEIVMTDNIENFFTHKIEFNNLVTLRSIFPEKTISGVPSGKEHTIPGILIMFIMMNTLIYGGAMLLYEREKGLIPRMMFSPLSISALWTAKMIARVTLGLIQTFILLLAGIIFFNLNLGDPFAALLIVFVFTLSISALSILFGSIFNKEEIVIGLSILSAQVFAGMGGCWWPIEVVSETMKKAGMLTPSYWAMDAFHGLIFFRKGFADIVPNILILSFFTLVFALLSIKFFRIKD